MIDISVITVNYNNAKGLAETRESLAHLDSGKFTYEWIVVDAASQDDSLLEAKKVAPAAARVDISSEPDGGIYDGMNKGLKRANGIFCIFMNSGDIFLDRSAEIIDEFVLPDSNDTGIFVFGIESRRNGSNINIRKFISPDQLRKYPAAPHQSTLIRTNILRELDGYDCTYTALADYDFFCRAYNAGVVFKYFSAVHLAVFMQGGLSTSPDSHLVMISDAANIQSTHFKKIHYPYVLALKVKYILSRLPWGSKLENLLRRMLTS